MKKEPHGTATNGQFVELTHAFMIALAELVKVFPINSLLKLCDNGYVLTKILKSIVYASINDKPILMLEGDVKSQTLGVVTVGNKSSQDLYKSLKKSRHEIDRYATEVLQDEYGYYQGKDAQSSYSHWPHYEASETVESLNLVAIRVADLGFFQFPQSPLLTDIYERAQNLGYKLCPHEVGPTLFDQHSKVDFKGRIIMYVAMDPVLIPPPGSGNHAIGIFQLVEKKQLGMCPAWLHDTRFTTDSVFIFVDKDKET